MRHPLTIDPAKQIERFLECDDNRGHETYAGVSASLMDDQDAIDAAELPLDEIEKELEAEVPRITLMTKLIRDMVGFGSHAEVQCTRQVSILRRRTASWRHLGLSKRQLTRVGRTLRNYVKISSTVIMSVAVIVYVALYQKDITNDQTKADQFDHNMRSITLSLNRLAEQASMEKMMVEKLGIISKEINNVGGVDASLVKELILLKSTVAELKGNVEAAGIGLPEIVGRVSQASARRVPAQRHSTMAGMQTISVHAVDNGE